MANVPPFDACVEVIVAELCRNYIQATVAKHLRVKAWLGANMMM